MRFSYNAGMKQQSAAAEPSGSKSAIRTLPRVRAGSMRAFLLLLAFLTACTGDLDTPGEALRLLGGNLPEAFVGERYDAALRPAGGLRPYTFTVSGDELPPGLELSQGAVQGVPLEAGAYAFTVTVSDANLSKTFLEHKLLVSEIPPPRLTVELPLTEVRAPVTIRVGVADARDLKGLRTRVRWDPEKFSFVPGSVRSSGSATALFDLHEDDWLQVDMAWLGRTQSGERQVFSFQLAPHEVATPGLVLGTEFAGSGTHEFTFASASAGARVPERQAARTEPADEATDEDAVEAVDEAVDEAAPDAGAEPETATGTGTEAEAEPDVPADDAGGESP